MTWVVVIADVQSNTVLAACTAAKDEKRLDTDVIGDKLSLLFDTAEIELKRAEVYARQFDRTDAMEIVAVPHRYSIKVTTDATTQEKTYELQEPNEEVTLDLTGAKPVINVNSGATQERKAWVIVKSANSAPVRKYEGIPAQDKTVTFSITIAAGDVVIGMVEGHRADIAKKA